MGASTTTYALGYVGALLFVAGMITACAGVVIDPKSALRVWWHDYENSVDQLARFLMLKQDGASIARAQLIAGLLVFPVAFVLNDPIIIILIVPIAFGPFVILKSRAKERVQAIEQQLDSWLLMLSNALKASPSLGDAVRSSARLTRAPLVDELDLALKEMRLGTPLDQAILNMSSRIGSTAVSSALATILVGRQTGGDLPRILEASASTLREMARLEGVIRTKTAEGKTQAYVLGAIPFFLIGAIYSIDSAWLDPLWDSFLGYLILGVATLLWVGAILLARKILTVDI